MSEQLKTLLRHCVKGERAPALAILEQRPQLLNEPWPDAGFEVVQWDQAAVQKGDTPLLAASLGLGEAAGENKLTLIKDLIAFGANVNAVNSHGFSALTCASCTGQIPIVTLLLESGALVNFKGSKASSALHWAARKNHPEVCLALLRRGADLEFRHGGGLTPLHEYGMDRWWEITNEALAATKTMLVDAFRAGPHTSQVQRRGNERWARRWAFVSVIVGSGFRPLSAKLRATEAAARSEHSTSAPLPPILLDTHEKIAAYRKSLVLSNDGLLRLIVSFV